MNQNEKSTTIEKTVTIEKPGVIRVDFAAGTTGETIQNLIASCEDGTCGCGIDIKNDFQSMTVQIETPSIKIQVNPDRETELTEKMNACGCNIC